MYLGPFTRKPPPGTRLPEGRINGGFYLCGESGRALADASGRNPPMLLQGTVDRVAGPFGGPALKPDGATGYGVIKRSGNNSFNWSTGNTNPRPRTIWAWVFCPTAGSDGRYFCKGDNITNSGFEFFSVSNGLRSIYIGSSNGRANQSTASTIPTGRWVMVAVTWNGVIDWSSSTNYPKFYVNGVDGGTTVTTTGGLQNAADTFDVHVMHDEDGNVFGAHYVDHIAWDLREYSPQEILRLCAEPFGMFAASRYAWEAPGASNTARPQVSLIAA